MTAQRDKETILATLQNGALTVQGQFINGSNYTFLGEVQSPTDALRVVYKPVRGEQPLWDFPSRSLARREVAAYLVSEALGWELVPPTVYRKRAPLGSGSIQLFVNHDPDRHYFSFTSQEKERLKPAAAFDVLVNNADRKGGHCIVDEENHLWGIDHGITFHAQHKLRTVIWNFVNQPIADDLLADIQKLRSKLETENDAYLCEMETLISKGELRAFIRRIDTILTNKFYPAPGPGPNHPWPPV